MRQVVVHTGFGASETIKSGGTYLEVIKVWNMMKAWGICEVQDGLKESQWCNLLYYLHEEIRRGRLVREAELNTSELKEEKHKNRLMLQKPRKKFHESMKKGRSWH